MQGGTLDFDRKRRDALLGASGQKGFTAIRWSPAMSRNLSSSLLASFVGSLIVSVLLVGVTTSLIA
jgi:hypothetical protein